MSDWSYDYFYDYFFMTEVFQGYDELENNYRIQYGGTENNRLSKCTYVAFLDASAYYLEFVGLFDAG